MCPAGKAAVTGYSYELAHADGTTQKVGDLTGNKVRPGDHITVTFAIAPECTDVEVSLASYRAPAASFDPNTAVQQTLYDSDTGFFDAGGGHTLVIDVPATRGTPGPIARTHSTTTATAAGPSRAPGPVTPPATAPRRRTASGTAAPRASHAPGAWATPTT
jgi:hypothetical protein